MDHRIGTCSSCGARYKIPASFQANRAKCKKCGSVVEIAAPQPAKGKTQAPAAKTETASGRQASGGQAADRERPRKGPSMKEQLVARRAEEAQPKGDKPAAPRAAAPNRGRAGTEPRAARGAASGAPARGQPDAASAKRSGSSTRRKPAGASRRARKTDEDDGAAQGRRRGSSSAQKGNPVPMFIGSAVVLLLVGYGIWEMFLKAPEQSAPQPGTAAEQGAQPENPDAALAAADTSSDAAKAPSSAVAEASTTVAEPAPEKPKPKQLHDPSSVDLTAIADYTPFAGTADGTWNELRRAMAEFVDPDAGAAGSRARKRLEAKPRQAFPVILNFFKRMDFATDEGHRNGDLCQRLLQDICGGRNFGWKYGDVEENERVTFNKKVVRSWCRSWDQANENTLEGNQAWAKLTKQGEKPGAAQPSAEESGPDLGTGDLDDLDDF